MPSTMYDGDVILDFDPGSHSYTINGVAVPSVTRITGVIDKPALVYWAVNEMESRMAELWQPDKLYTHEQIQNAISDAKGARFRKSSEALNIGSMAHDWIEQYVKSIIYDYAWPKIPDYEPVKRAVYHFQEWEKEHDVAFVSSERRVCSVVHMYSGTADIDAVVNGKRIIIDLKTSKGIYDEYYLQCAAYANALSEETSVDYAGVGIMRLPKVADDSLEFACREDVDELFSTFEACLKIWRWKNNWKGKQ